MIHVCYCFCDKTGRYAKFAATSMLSLLENTKSEVTVHILHDNTLTEDNRDKFSYIANRYEQTVQFYNLSEFCSDKIAKIINMVPEVETATVTVGTFYKLLIPQALPEEIKKAVFIDPDTIVNLDIDELWQVELEDKVLGAVTEVAVGTNSAKAFLLCSGGIVNEENYFNCGVLLMNLDVLREDEDIIMQGVKFRGYNPKQKFFEQTVLNYCFSEQALKLPEKFNYPVKIVRQSENPDVERKIYHYTTGSSRMGLEMNDPCNALWFSYFIKTPFFNEKVIGQLYERLQKIRTELKEVPLKLSAIMPGKMRVFFIEPQKVDSMKKFFSIKDYEEIILAENEDSFQKLIDTMQNSKGMCVFFILTEKFLKKKFPFDRLKKEGFTEGKDFIKAWTFLSEAQGVTFNSYSFIQEM